MVSLSKSLAFLLILAPLRLISQEKVIVDKIVAIVGKNEILQSDIENQYLMLQAQKQNADKCEIFESFLVQKLVVNQAKIDSIEINDANVELQLENRMKYFIDQAGSKEKLEEYYKRSIFQIKEDMRDPLREQMLMQKMQGEITGNVKITPTDVKKFYENLPQDSIPLVNSQVEYLQIVKYPPYSDQSIYQMKQDLLGLRKRILDGEKFSTMAYLYSEDPTSARNGGEIGFMSKGELDPDYARVAFGLKMNAVSNIVETQFGYHIIQLIGKADDRINTRHILKKPKATDKEIKLALSKLDSIVTFIKADSFSFERAALFFSEDKNSRLSGGKMVNQNSGSTKFENEQLPQEDYYVIKKLKVNEISEPFMSKDENKKDVFKVIKLISRTEPHKANLKEDYQLLQDLTMEAQKQKVLQDWVAEKQKVTYIRIDDSYKSCKFKSNGWFSK
jgi:peptidyl-prolyl cis-trans isomerase SurA